MGGPSQTEGVEDLFNESQWCFYVHLSCVDDLSKYAGGEADDHVFEFVKQYSILLFGEIWVAKKNVDYLNTGCNDLLYSAFVIDIAVDVVVNKQVVCGGFHGSIWLKDPGMVQIPWCWHDLSLFAILYSVIPLEFVEMVTVIFLEGIIIELCCGKQLCNVVDVLPAGWAEVGFKHETVL